MTALTGIGCQTLLQPILRPWKTSGIIIELYDHFCNALIGLTAGIAIHKISECTILGSIISFHDIFCNIRLQKLQLRLIAKSEGRIQFQHFKMLPNCFQTQTVNRRNLCTWQKKFLSNPPGVFRLLLQFFIKPLPDSFPHLSGGCIGKCNHKKTFNLHRMFFVRQLLYQPFYQNCRFA